ncbi:MAG: ATP synthase F1 subunit delta [Solirubrobacterales bacterium]
MEEVARTYAEALFGTALEQDKLDTIRDQLGEFADALREDSDLELFFLGPHFSSEEKKDALHDVLEDPDEHFLNFCELLIEKQRMPVIFRIRREYEERWARENDILEVTVTSAVELDEDIVEDIRSAVEDQTDSTVELETRVDEGIIGGLVLQVGNKVLDASISNRLEKFRRQVASAA